MRVSLDVSAVPANPAGAGRYTLELVKALSVVDDGVGLSLITRRDDVARWTELARTGIAEPASSLATLAHRQRQCTIGTAR